jgi:hypothetical protein
MTKEKGKDMLLFKNESSNCPKCKKETVKPHEDWKDCLKAIEPDFVVSNVSMENATN